MPETNIVLWTFENAKGDYLFPQTSLNQVFLSDTNPTVHVAQGGVMKRAYVPHDITPIIGRFDNEHIPNPDDFMLEEKYYSLDTNKVHTIKAKTDWTDGTSVTFICMRASAPVLCVKGDKYFNTSSNLIYTATGTNTWGSESVSPSTTVLYIDLDTNKAYRWLNSEMQVSHRWTDGTTLEEDRIVVDTSNHHAYHYHGGVLQDITTGGIGDLDFEPD